MFLDVSSIANYPKTQNLKLNFGRVADIKYASKPKHDYVNSNFDLSFQKVNLEPDFYPLPYIEKYIAPQVIQHAIDANPNISLILEFNGIEPKIYEKNIDNRLKTHLLTTYLYAKEIANKINLDTKSKEILYKAALLHDIGKALIPDEIVQKPGKLTKSEREIIDLHAQLGYEILKTTDVDFDIMEAVRLHHTPICKDNGNLIAHILSVVDVFSALKEERAYKTAMTNAEAFSIMTSCPELSQEYVRVLKGLHNS